MAVDLSTHKLLAMALLDDDIGVKMSPDASDTYWRGFVLQDRTTGEYSFRFRFEYKSHCSWIQLKPGKTITFEEFLEKLKVQVVGMLVIIGQRNGAKVTASDFHWYVVPEEDREDSGRTVVWLEMQDLVNPPRFEKI